MLKVLLTIGFLLILAVASSYYFFFGKSSNPALESQDVITELSPEVEDSLDERIATISKLISEDQFIISSIKEANAEHASLTENDISERDKMWIESNGQSAFVNEILESEVSKWLRDFQKDRPEYIEIFITSDRGLNIGQTNITSDYYQADEEWWIKSFAGGLGMSSHGPIEFDESAQSVSISLYVPVVLEGKALGVVKAVVDIVAIEEGL